MALSNPATRAEFFDLIRAEDVQVRLRRSVQINNLAGGEILQAELAPAMWEGSVSMPAMAKRAAAEIQAALAVLEAPGRRFLAYKHHQIGPAGDRLGAGLDGFAPQIAAAPGVDKLSLSGLPPSYEVLEGDFVAFEYDPGSGPRRAFHQVFKGASAGGSGVTSAPLHVVPNMRAGLALGAVVELVKPAFLAVLVPGSVSYGITRGNVTSGISFEFRQTLRA